MSWDNSHRVVVGIIETQTELNRRFTNLKQLRGSDTAQTEIDTQAEAQSLGPLSCSTAATMDIRKSFRVDDGNTADIGLVAENASGFEGNGILDGQYAQANQVLRKQDLTYEQTVGIWKFSRITDGNGYLQAAGVRDEVGQENLTITVGDTSPLLGIFFPVPVYPLDVGAGILNITGSYKLGNTTITDWTETLAPNKLSWTGNAQVTKFLKSTVATGTAPLVVASTDVCPYMDAEQLHGYGWHPGLFSTAAASFTGSDSDIATLALDRAGDWEILATVRVDTASADAGLEHDVKLKHSGGTQIGITGSFDAQLVTIGAVTYGCSRVVRVFGKYTAPSAAETVKATVAVPTGSGGSARAYIFARWIKS